MVNEEGGIAVSVRGRAWEGKSVNYTNPNYASNRAEAGCGWAWVPGLITGEGGQLPEICVLCAVRSVVKI